MVRAEKTKSWKEPLKRLIKKSKYLIILRAILHGHGIKTRSGTAHKAMTLEQSLDYINRVFTDYMLYADLKYSDLKDKVVLEVGPGDNLGVALKFIAKGAQKIVCCDRFFSERDNNQQLEIYKALLESMNPDERERARQAIVISDHTFSFCNDKIDYVYGISVEEAYKHFPKQSFDLIVSRAVLEHIYDSDQAIKSMHKLLKDNGLLIHKVDLRDHKIFSGAGMSELEFLTVPDFLWRWISPHGGKVNRNRIDFYRNNLSMLNYEYRLLTTHIVGHDYDMTPYKIDIEEGIDYTEKDLEEVFRIKPRMIKRFRALPEEDLLITGIFLVGRKKPSVGDDYTGMIAKRLRNYFPKLPKEHQIIKQRTAKKSRCSIIDEWRIKDNDRHWPTLMIKKGCPNDLYNDKFKADLAKEFESLKLLNEHKGNGFSVPHVYDFLPEHNVMVMEKIESARLGDVLIKGVNAYWKNKNGAYELLFRRCGHWLERFHAFTCVDHRFKMNAEVHLRKFRKVARICQVYGLPKGLIEAVEKRMQSLCQYIEQAHFDIALKHGDFQPNNILVRNNQITVIDISGYKNDVTIKDICNFLVGFQVMLIRSLQLLPDKRLNGILKRSFLDGYFNDKTIPLDPVQFFSLLGLLESFEKMCARRGKGLRELRIRPYFQELIRQTLEEHAYDQS